MNNIHFPPWFAWSNVLLALLVLYVVICLWRWHNDPDDPFDVRDLFADDGKASQQKIIVLGMAVLAAWVVVKKTLAGADVETLLLGVLGIFVLRSAVGKVSDAIANRPAAPPTPNIGNVVNVGDATEVPLVPTATGKPPPAVVAPTSRGVNA